MEEPFWLEGFRDLVLRLEAAKAKPPDTPFIAVMIERWTAAVPAVLVKASDHDLRRTIAAFGDPADPVLVALVTELHRRGLDG